MYLPMFDLPTSSSKLQCQECWRPASHQWSWLRRCGPCAGGDPSSCLRFRMSTHSHVLSRASRHLSRRFRRPSRYSRFISRHSSSPVIPAKAGMTGGGRSALNPEPIYRMTALVFVAVLFGLVVGSFLNVVIHRGRAASRWWARIPLPALWGVHPDPGQHSPVSIHAAPRAVQELQGTHIRALPSCGGNDRTPLWRRRLACAWGMSLLSPRAGPHLSPDPASRHRPRAHEAAPQCDRRPAALAGLLYLILANPAGWWTYPLSASRSQRPVRVGTHLPSDGHGRRQDGGMLGAFLGPYAALAVFLGARSEPSRAVWSWQPERCTAAAAFGLFMALGGIISLFAGPQLWELYKNLVWG